MNEASNESSRSGEPPFIAKYRLKEVEEGNLAILEEDDISLADELTAAQYFQITDTHAVADQVDALVSRLTAHNFCRDAPAETNLGAAEEVEERSPQNTNRDAEAEYLQPEATVLYDKANGLYLGMENRQHPYIEIESGLRDTTEQADLYKKFIYGKYYGGPNANSANKPGTSNHEFGLAIDIVRGGDGERLRSALIAAGWTDDIADEGWHFNASAIASWGRIQAAKDAIKPLSEQFGDAVSNMYDFMKRAKEHDPIYKKGIEGLDEQTRRLNPESEYLNKKSAEIKWITERKERIRLYNNDVAELDRSLERISSLRYTDCPKGKSFEDCCHTELLQRWVDKKNAAIDAHNQRDAELQQRSLELKAEYERIKSEQDNLKSRLEIFQRDTTKFNADLAEVNALYDRITGWVKQAKTIEEALPGKIAEIQDAVDAVWQ